MLSKTTILFYLENLVEVQSHDVLSKDRTCSQSKEIAKLARLLMQSLLAVTVLSQIEQHAIE